MQKDQTAIQEFQRKVQHTDEQYVKNNFWEKLRQNLTKIPFLESVLAMYYAAVDPKTPRWAKAVAFGGLAYFILPIDMIPDPLIIAGWTDDAAILTAAIKTLASRVTDEHRKKAHEWIRLSTPSTNIK